MNTSAERPRTIDLWILDDDAEMCSLLGRQCKALGWSLRPFHHPRQLPEALRSSKPDLLLLDQLLPEKHGLDVLHGLMHEGKGFPVLILSALGAPSDRVTGLEAGADDYLAKPFHFRELQLRVERLLRSAGVSPATETVPPAQTGRFALATLVFEAGPQLQLQTPDGSLHRLSRGDGAMLSAFCQQPGVVISRAHLLRVTGSLVTPGQSRTIDVRLSRLRRLLRELAGSDLIVPERGQGYKLVVDAQDLANGQQVSAQA
jgi:two-component system phosphate regulon response regulator OmpR